MFDGTNSTRRSFLKGFGAVTAGGALPSSSVAAGGPGPRRRSTGNSERGGGFPPGGTTEYGRSVILGDGEVRPFTTETPSGEPKYHGVEFDRDALRGELPSADDLEDADNRAGADKYRASGQAATIHYKQSLQFFVPFPGAADTPFTFLGLNWNPGGHFGGAGAWLRPHFDIHFHMLDTATVDSVDGPKLPPYDTSNGEYEGGSPAPDPDGEITSTRFDYEQLPEGYARSPEPVADQRYITDMGEHTAPLDAPELPDAPGEPGDPEEFTNTLIQGFVGVGENDDPRLAFVEPMITREFLNRFTGTEEYDVPQPEAYPHDKQHPTAYSVRDVPSKDAVTVVLEDFESV
ncbi:MAG: twin-arginine translocation signal domain-containing protein [Halobacteriales archaeon]